jgi:uncharacterized lipoprotein NlpE involved in copper resistance
MKKIYMMACLTLMMAACTNQQQKKSEESTKTDFIADIHNAENALDYEGTYKGTFPAADCPGIETTLTLNNDRTFTLDSKYIDRNQTYNESGKYTLKGNLLTLVSNDGEEEYYKVEENRLRKLDRDKKEITGDLAGYYILKKELQN